SKLTPEFALYVDLGWQRRWIFSKQAATLKGQPLLLPDEVNSIPPTSNRVFLRINSLYVFNPEELRQDLRNSVSLVLTGFRPTVSGDDGYLRLDFQGLRVFPFGWHELRLGASLSSEVGKIWFVDEIPLADHLRVGFGLSRYTHDVGSVNLE